MNQINRNLMTNALDVYLKLKRSIEQNESAKNSSENRLAENQTIGYYSPDLKTIQKPNAGKRILFLNTHYPMFLTNLYQANPELHLQPYDVQKQFILSTFFGDSDFYSRGLSLCGWEADDIIFNCPQLQNKWAEENYPGLTYESNNKLILLHQITKFQPDVVYIQEIVRFDGDFLREIKKRTSLLAGQIASNYGNYQFFNLFDVIFTSCPPFVNKFRKAGLKTHYVPLGFDPRIWEKVKSVEKSHDATFIGGISNIHSSSIETLEYLAQNTAIEFFGYISVSLPQDSAILMKHRGQVWGLDMFRELAASRITFNRHIFSVSENYSSNMRLFEATGCNSLLITDYSKNLSEFFEIGKEVIAYRSAEEAAALINYYQRHPDEAKEISQNGQKRTLKDHTYEKRMEITAEILERQLYYAKVNPYYFNAQPKKISTGYKDISQSEVTQAHLDAWKNETIPQQQRALVQKELDLMYSGKSLEVCDVLARVLSPLVKNDTSLLEIGCASGYYYEILSYLLNKKLNYTGVDYSEALINLAKEFYPKAHFITADGANIPLESNSKDIVISAGVLLHVPNYVEQIKESIRISNRYVIFHKTPICKLQPTKFQEKEAYGIKTVELIFNLNEFEQVITNQGLEILESVEFNKNLNKDTSMMTFLCKKKLNKSSN